MKNLQPKKSSRLFILLGVVLTVLSMLGVYAISSSSSKNAASGTTPVLVAARVIPSKTVFGSLTDVAAWTSTENLPSNELPPVYYTSAAAFKKQVMANGKVVNSQTILPKEVLVDAQFTSLGTRNSYTGALTLPKNDVAVSLQTTIVNESGGAITPGDYVDLVSSYLPSGGGGSGGATESPPISHSAQTGFVLQDIKVIAVGPFVPGSTAAASNSVAASGSTMLTFQCDRHTALIIQHLKDFGGSWDYSVFLRSAYSSKTYGEYPVLGKQFLNTLKNDFVK